MRTETYTLHVYNCNASADSLDSVDARLIRSRNFNVDLIWKRVVVHIEQLHPVADSSHTLRVLQVALCNWVVNVQSAFLDKITQLC